MTNKEKLELTETRIYETRQSMRQIQRMFSNLRCNRENVGIVTSEELKQIEEVEELLREIEFRINDRVFDMK